MTRTAVMDLGSSATVIAVVPDEPTPIVVRPIAAHRRDSDGHAEELSQEKPLRERGATAEVLRAARVPAALSHVGPRNGPHNPPTFGAARRSRAAPLPPVIS